MDGSTPDAPDASDWDTVPKDFDSVAVKIEIVEDEFTDMGHILSETSNDTDQNQEMDTTSLEANDDPVQKTNKTAEVPRKRKQNYRNIKRNIPSLDTNGEDTNTNSTQSAKSKQKRQSNNKKKQEKKGGIKQAKMSKSTKKLTSRGKTRKHTVSKKKPVSSDDGNVVDCKEGCEDQSKPEDISMESEGSDAPEGNSDDNDDVQKPKYKFGFISCGICKKRLSTQSNMRRHWKSASCIPCDIGDYGETTDKPVRATVEHEIPVAERTCSVCEKVLSSPANLRRHTVSLHSQEKPILVYKYMCTFEGCTRRFTLPSNRKKHCDAVHLNIRKYLCDICSHMFKTSCALKTHLKTRHIKNNDKTSMSECPVCKRLFSTKFKLQAHVTVHTNIKPFACEVEGCDKVFRLKDSLRKHMKMHQNYKPFLCNICGQSFTRKLYLETHQYKHTGIKMFKCTVCDKSFSQKGNLYVHMKSHGDKHIQYRCKLCEKTYMTKQSLVQHRRIQHAVHGEDSEDELETKPKEESEADTALAVSNIFFPVNSLEVGSH